MKRKISVLMPVYNQEEFLDEAIQSILKQSFNNFEFLILDDGSKDNSFKIVKSFKDKRIKVFRNKKRNGLAKSLNILIKESKGEYLARMDGDDISLKDRLKKQVEFLDKNKLIVILGCWAKIIDSQGRNIGQFKYPTEDKVIRNNILSYNPFVHSSVMMRKEIFKKIGGGYNEGLFYSQDYDLFLRIAAKYACANLAEYLLKFRWLPNFKKQKQQNKLALKIRFKAIKDGDYSWGEIIKLIKPFLLYLIPLKLKEIYWQSKFRCLNEKNK
ncbi:hypothetical protein COT75_01650 [Candidatus Beckwithbacteria bacterium CG10_big_fil_rev_8_21_14_0_10_34_10]|uniref:Glycosyltransferase 2-like domain-containing protein n=1 Tax=Candidatus Beckwithbacteria bacterium CG10_big_fil_rev_8_21_14_0_10_34_10 TaxID=1974495 RepID=A0A2H0W9M8_9BACT|nr:MAG: hypothetical protein COT75_01650 [Candidatus Beckwithbacteria bacterium CG10_big_fil_rev_8_21_14_0_10_34_10]